MLISVTLTPLGLSPNSSFSFSRRTHHRRVRPAAPSPTVDPAAPSPSSATTFAHRLLFRRRPIRRFTHSRRPAVAGVPTAVDQFATAGKYLAIGRGLCLQLVLDIAEWRIKSILPI
nr:hypothetical protein Itr_chr06CG08220 [Ipomoea trifida]